MENTYTYTARSADNPEKVVTFTLRGSKMTVGPGAALETIEKAITAATDEDQEGPSPHLWLKPTAVALVERGTGPFRVQDVTAGVDDNGYLSLSAWLRPAGLRLFPVPLMHGRVDNPDAAKAFVKELESRKEEAGMPSPLLGWMDYWATWLIAGGVLFAVLESWRRGQREQ
jgi:hypothetical protein